MNDISYSIKLNGTITDSNGHKMDITESDITHMEVKSPRGKGRFVIRYFEDDVDPADYMNRKVET